MKKASWIAAMALAAASMSANAALVTINPDDFAAGTNISNATEGVTLSAYSWASAWFDPAVNSPTSSAIYAQGCPSGCNAFTGQSVFGGSNLVGYASNSFGNVVKAHLADTTNVATFVTGFSVFRADFDVATGFVQVDVGGGGSNTPLLTAYDAAGHQISGVKTTTNLTPGLEGVRRMSITSSLGNIAYVFIGGGDGPARVDNFIFDRNVEVPEPATLGMFMLGLAGVGAMRRRSAKQS